jgi:hypothetical protein
VTAFTEVLFDNASFFWTTHPRNVLRDAPAPRRCSIQKLTGSKISDVAHQLNHAVQKTLLRQPAIQKKRVDIPPFGAPLLGSLHLALLGFFVEAFVGDKVLRKGMRQPQVCDLCGGRFGLLTHRWWSNKFCKKKCKDAHLRELAFRRDQIRRWYSQGGSKLPS